MPFQFVCVSYDVTRAFRYCPFHDLLPYLHYKKKYYCGCEAVCGRKNKIARNHWFLINDLSVKAFLVFPQLCNIPNKPIESVVYCKQQALASLIPVQARDSGLSLKPEKNPGTTIRCSNVSAFQRFSGRVPDAEDWAPV